MNEGTKTEARRGRPATRSSEARLGAVEPTTEGQRLLLARSESHAELAERLGTSRQSVHQWRAGSIQPKTTMRQRLAEVAQIPADAWDRAPGTSAPSAPTEVTAPRPAAPLPASVPFGSDEVAELEALIGQVVAKREGLSATGLIDSIKLELALRERRTKALERAELQEPRYVAQHPTWQKIRAGLLEVLRAHPAVLRDVVALLQGLGV